MKSYIFFLVILFCVFSVKAQKIYIPDDSFEQVLINLGLDDVFDDSVVTSSIDTVTVLYLSNYNITELTGIEYFTELRRLFCSDNQIIELDLRYNINLLEFNCRNNMLTFLDVRNGNNLGLLYFTASNNPSLFCITVDEIANANANWDKDISCVFSDNCSTSIEVYSNSEKKLIKVLDLYGREIISRSDLPLFYIYDDGTVEKKIILK